MDAAFIKHNYSTLPDGHLIALAKKDGASLTTQAFNILKEEFTKRKLDTAIIEAAEQNRLIKQQREVQKINEGKGEDILKPLWNYAFFDIKQGKTYQEVFEGLLDKGVDESIALKITEGLEIKADSLVKKAERKISAGAICFFAGVAITFLTIANPINGRYFVMTGLILFGGIAFFTGITSINGYKKILANCIKQRELLEAEERVLTDEY